MRERFFQNAERKFWKGSPIVIAKDVLMGRGATHIPINLTPNSLPPLHGLSSGMLNDAVHVSVGSRYAQLGINLNDDIVGQVVQRITKNTSRVNDDNILSQLETKILAFNYCSRPISIPKGTQLFLFFYESTQSIFRGKDLVSLVESGEIKIDGKQGFDWVWSYNQIGSGEEDIIGIDMRIKSKGRKWIPPDSNNLPIALDINYDSNEYDYRQKINTMLHEIPSDNQEKLWIGETVSVSLGQSVNAILDKAVHKNPKNIDVKTAGALINSRVAYGGKTNWPIRTEILSSTIPEHMPDFIHLNFVRSGN